MMQTLTAALFPLFMILAGAGDAITMRIPNWVVASILLLFFPVAWYSGMPAQDYLWHLAVFGVLLAIGFLLFSLNKFGAGDAKLLAAAGLWFGWPDAGKFVVWTALAGGVLALAAMFWSLAMTDSEIRGGFMARRMSALKPDIPYGFAFAAGALLSSPGSWWAAIGG
jgi:prepilin peptidase CpaA